MRILRFFLLIILAASGRSFADEIWQRYAIDSELRGADGVKLADANRDGLPDIVSGWEESGQARAYIHPGKSLATSPWPKVDIGRTPSVEDAVWVDLNGDGQLDVLSSCEGREQSLRFHLAPEDRSRLLQSDAWQTKVFEESKAKTRWMFALPFPVAKSTKANPKNRALPAIAVASKNPNGMLGLVERPSNNPKSWRITRLADADWIMSLILRDMNQDGLVDILYSDRKGKDSGIYWLQQPKDASAKWKRHFVGAAGTEVMFLAEYADSIYAAIKPNSFVRFDLHVDSRQNVQVSQEGFKVEPRNRIGNAKGIAVGDLDGDGVPEVVFSCESATAPKSGVVYLKQEEGKWQMHDVSGPDGIKFDLIELVDLDLDGDLDILTCEERHEGRGLGVIWYANPSSQ